MAREISDKLEDNRGKLNGLIELPELLAKLRDSREFLAAGIIEHSVSGMLDELADTIYRAWRIGKTSGIKRIGAGSESWTFRADDEVLLVSQLPIKEAYQTYHLKRWISSRLRKAGVNTPRSFGVGALPLPHMISKFAGGTSLQDLWEDEASQQTLMQSVAKLGEAFRAAKSIPIQGYGELLRTQSRDYAGEHQDLKAAFPLRSQFEAFKEDKSGEIAELLAGRLISESDRSNAEQIYSELVESEELPIIFDDDLTLNDVIYDPNSDSISLIDLTPKALPPVFAVLSVCRSIEDFDPPERKREFLEKFLEAFEPDLDKRVELIEQAGKAYVLSDFLSAANFITEAVGRVHFKVYRRRLDRSRESMAAGSYSILDTVEQPPLW